VTEDEWLRMRKENLEADLAETRQSLDRSRRSANFWRAAFEHIADDVGDLMRAARAGQVVTAEQLEGILDREAEAGADEG
jgi:spore germination protein YaaH